jgi:hypothetical protein
VGDGKEKVENGPEELDEVDPEDEDVVPNPEVLRQAASRMGDAEVGNGEEGAEKKEKKKPRKLEVRGK